MWKVLEDKLEFIRGNAALLVFTKNPETFLFTIFDFPQTGNEISNLVFIFSVRLSIFLDQYLAKLCEVYGSCAIIHLIDYFIDLNL